jgi:hypothetical protein
MTTPLVLEIRSSIIFPRSVPVNITGEAPPFNPDETPAAAPVILQTGPDHPVYRLPQSLSSPGLKVHLNEYVKPKPRHEISSLNRRSSISTIDEGHVIFRVAKASIGDSSSEYTITNYRRDDGDGYGRGHVRFVPGWISGGTWEVSYVYKKPEVPEEQRIDMTCDEGGSENGIWKMTYPFEGVVARELEQPQGEFGENGKAVEVMPGPPGLEGWSPADWRDFIMAVFITKVWRDCTKTSWMGAGVAETSMLRRW